MSEKKGKSLEEEAVGTVVSIKRYKLKKPYRND